jgi:hypothetical protein
LRARLLEHGLAALALCMCAAPGTVAAAPASGTVPLLLDGERIYAQVSFVRPDGTRHETLAFVDLGGPSLDVSAELMSELQLDRRPVTLEVGMPVQVEPRAISGDPGLRRSALRSTTRTA